MDFETRLKRVPLVTSIVAMGISFTLMMIWIFFPSLKQFSAGSMKFNTSIAVQLSSLSLFFLRNPKWKSRIRLMSTIIFLIGFATTFEYIFHSSLGIDELFVSDFNSPESILFPGRMSPIASCSFILLGSSLFFHQASSIRLQNFSQIMCLTLFYACVFCLIGYLYEEKFFYKVGPYIRISWQSAFCLLNLSMGLMFTPTSAGLRVTLATRGLGGIIARRLLPVIIITPVTLGYLWIYLRRNDIVSREFGVSIFVILTIAIFFSMITFVSRRLTQVESQLQQAVVVRDDFLSIASHELKTPLTSLKLQNQIFEMKVKDNEAQAFTKDYLLKVSAGVDKHASRLNHLINDMLDISRMQSGKFNLKLATFDLREMIEETVFEMNIPHLELDLKDSITGRWDRLRIEQVLTNLLTNAERYGKGKPITVRLELNGSEAVISVIDQGQGISESNFERIFKRYERLDAASYASGLGLGLFITQQIVDAHHGKIEVLSKLGEGSTFTVRLPI